MNNAQPSRPLARRRPADRVLWLILGLTVALSPANTGAGGVPSAATPPEPIRSDWLSVRVPADGDIVPSLAKIPQDANPLGAGAAHLRTAEYPRAFEAVKLAAADGTPLAGTMAIHRDQRPRPAVVIVPGFTQTMNLKFVVEIADLFARNGWHVLTIDLRGHGESRKLSPALITSGWKETLDVLGAARYVKDASRARSVAVVGFSMGGRSLVKAMAEDEGRLITAGIAVTAPLAAYAPIKPPPPGSTPTRIQKFFLDFLGAPSMHEYYSRSARSYGVDLQTMQALTTADTAIARVRRPLLMLYALDDFLVRLQLKQGRHDGGTFSLAYRDSVREHPHVRTMIVDRGNHAGMLYLSDPHWFTVTTLMYLKHWQARELDYVTASAPPLDVLIEAELQGQTTRYRMVVRNHGANAAGPLDLHLRIPAYARLEQCWVGFEGLGRCATEGQRLSWTLPRLAGGKTSAGPFTAVIDVSRVPGPVEAVAWVTSVDRLEESLSEEYSVALPQQVRLEKR